MIENREEVNRETIAQYIDHTLLSPDSTWPDVKNACQQAQEWGTASVCVPPNYVSESAEFLEDSRVKIDTVIGFPLGYSKHTVKLFELLQAIEDGADEVDIVMNIGKFKQRKKELVLNNLESLVVSLSNNTVKVIIETALLSKEEIKQACNLVVRSGANFVKTSTGFASEGATIENVKLMKKTVQDEIKIKAAGGIRTFKQAKAMLEAGADRIGTSSSEQIITG